MLILTFMYETYIKFAYDPSDRDNGCLRRSKLRSLSNWWFRITVTIYSLMLTKYLFLWLLNLDCFAEYRFIDCYILGRLAFSSQSYNATRVLIVISLVFNLTFRFIIVNWTVNSVNYELFRFLELDSEEVVWNEVQLKRYHKAFGRAMTDFVIESTRKFNKAAQRFSLQTVCFNSTPEPQYGKIRFHFENPFQIQPGSLDSCLLRLNRTPDARQKLKRAMTIYYPIAVLFFMVNSALFAYFFILGTTLTSMGFSVNYHNCVSYIASLGPEGSLYYSHIYRGDGSQLLDRAIPSMPVSSVYHIIRSSVDLLENAFIWCECFLAVTLHTTFMFVQLVDLLVYSEILKERVKSTIEFMRYESMSTVEHVEAVANRLHPLVQSAKDLESVADLSPATTQAHVLDYLRLVASYRDYARFQTFAILLVWITMTAGISFWLAVNKFDDLHGEWRWSQAGLALYAVSAMGFLSYFESNSRKLYNLMSSATAVDADLMETKERWCHLTMFFYPKPMYCIAIFDVSKYSWLSCMQVSQIWHGAPV